MQMCQELVQWWACSGRNVCAQKGVQGSFLQGVLLTYNRQAALCGRVSVRRGCRGAATCCFAYYDIVTACVQREAGKL